MRPLLRLLAFALACAPALLAQETLRFRSWMGGREVGGAVETHRREGAAALVERREWVDLDRMGLSVRQEITQQARREPDGRLAFTWSLKLAELPLEGRADWAPSAPAQLRLQPKGGAAKTAEVPPDAVLWPGDYDAKLLEAARLRRPVSMQVFNFPLGQWSAVVLRPAGAEPLPGFPDAVHFRGESVENGTSSPMEVWISPTAGDLRERSELGGLEIWTQRAELPPPPLGDQGGFFERSLKEIPPDPFLIWAPEVTVRFTGGEAPQLPETPEQHALGQGRWRLSRPAMPSAEELRQMPVAGKPSAEDAPYLATSPLLQFDDPAFDALLRRLDAGPGLGRWALARKVTDFVFDWIQDKDYSVGFASALEVCRNPKGDCTEHGVLAVALLRKLRVPARGVVGWLALDRVMGLHFWVEVRLGNRWVPVDPTFDQAPASAYRIALGQTDLADLGGVGWDAAALAFGTGRWVPQSIGTRPWGESPALAGDTVRAPDGTLLSLAGASWSLSSGNLALRTRQGSNRVAACPRPAPSQIQEATRMRSGGRSGWWDGRTRTLWMDLGDRWLQVDGVPETQAYDLLKDLKVEGARP